MFEIIHCYGDMDEREYGYYEELYDEMEAIGEGGFGLIMRCEHRVDGKEYAVKIIPYNHKNEFETVKECMMLSFWEHPNIVRYYNSWIEDKVPRCFTRELDFIPTKTLFIATEVLEQNLKEFLEGPISNDILDEVFKGLLNGLCFLKSKKVIHGDICPENILFDRRGTPKLIDFGAAEILGDEDDDFWDKDRAWNFFYFAPEVRKQGLYTSASDAFSSALSFMDALYPLEVIGPDVFYENVTKGKFPKKDVRCSHAMHDCLCSMLNEEASARPSADGLLQGMQH